MSWLTIALGLMKLSSALISYLHDNKMIEAGPQLRPSIRWRKPMPQLKKAARLAKYLIPILSFTLSGCATTTILKGQADQAPFCSVAEPIYWSGSDSVRTIKQVKAHNAVGKSLCLWGK